MIERRNKVIKEVLGIIIICFAYLIFVRSTKLYIPCLFRLITGYRCPGCGISHMFNELSKGNIVNAFHHNGFVLILLIPAIIYFFYRSKRYIKDNQTSYSILEIVILTIVLISAIIFAVYRNIGG